MLVLKTSAFYFFQKYFLASKNKEKTKLAEYEPVGTFFKIAYLLLTRIFKIKILQTSELIKNKKQTKY
jgi:hypothetical protein